LRKLTKKHYLRYLKKKGTEKSVTTTISKEKIYTEKKTTTSDKSAFLEALVFEI